MDEITDQMTKNKLLINNNKSNHIIKKHRLNDGVFILSYVIMILPSALHFLKYQGSKGPQGDQTHLLS